MNTKFSVFGTSLVLLIISAYLESPLLAQPEKVKFYCGRTNDDRVDPATTLAISGRKGGEHRTIVVWRNKVGRMTPEERCFDITKKFQLAWDRGSFNHLVPGINRKTGQGLICAVKEKNGPCDSNQSLFAVNNLQQANEITQELNDSIRKNGNPTYQSSSNESIDMKELIDSIGKSTEN